MCMQGNPHEIILKYTVSEGSLSLAFLMIVLRVDLVRNTVQLV